MRDVSGQTVGIDRYIDRDQENKFPATHLSFIFARRSMLLYILLMFLMYEQDLIFLIENAGR